jgi:hypothetical protein
LLFRKKGAVRLYDLQKPLLVVFLGKNAKKEYQNNTKTIPKQYQNNQNQLFVIG